MVAETVEFINAKGQSIILTNRKPFLLESVEGRGDVSADTQTQKAPYQDGVIIIDSVLDARNITLQVSIIADSRDELSMYRQHLSSIFNPKLGLGTLTYKNGETIREIQCKADGVPSFPVGDAKGKWFQKTSINLIAPDPYWKSLEIVEEPMAAFVGLFEFPFDDEFEIGIEGHTRTFVNNSDADVPLKITINGPVRNPQLANLTTNELIKVKRELVEGDVLEISTEKGNKYVRLNGDNAINWIDLSSKFWFLEPGENTVQFTADEGQESATLKIVWQERFLAV